MLYNREYLTGSIIVVISWHANCCVTRWMDRGSVNLIDEGNIMGNITLSVEAEQEIRASNLWQVATEKQPKELPQTQTQPAALN